MDNYSEQDTQSDSEDIEESGGKAIWLQQPGIKNEYFSLIIQFIYSDHINLDNKTPEFII
jgi:hypothetical protein